MPDVGDRAREKYMRETQPPEVEGVKIDWSPLPHPAIRDLRGSRFGKLMVKAYAYTREKADGIPMVYWLCQCDCGTDHAVSRERLTRGLTKSCGCLSPVGHKGVLASRKTFEKRSHMIKRIRAGLSPVAPIHVIGDPVCVFAYDSLMAYACFRWAGYVPAAHHHLIAKYLEKVEKGKIKRLMIFMPPRSGKLVADDTPILTPDGWKTHGELKVGDYVYGWRVNPVKVVAVSPKDYATLAVEFSNGDIIKCHKEHEWHVKFNNKEDESFIDNVETLAIKYGLSFGIKYSIPFNHKKHKDSGFEIVSIKECEPETGQCIQVDSPDGLYLVGKSLIPTHNSMIVSEYFPAWYLGRNPDKRVVCASYGQELASDFGRKVRNQMADPVYSEIFPNVGLAADSAAADKFNMAPPYQGGYVAVGVGGALTGRGAHCLIIDDPQKAREDADSESSQRKLRDWYTAVAYTRLMDDGAIVICQTRWNVGDLSGWLLKEHKHEKWTVLNLPAINEAGEPLWPERFPLPVLENIRKTLPARDWQALYQQQPFVEEGGIFKRMWWRLWADNKPLPDCEFIIQSWDTAFTDRDLKSNSFSARVTLGVFKRPDDDCHNVFLLEAWKGRVEYPELRKAAVQAYLDYTPDKVIIEKKASGQCYDDKTEILTRAGWKHFSEIDINNDEFATRNMDTHEFQWQKAIGEYHSEYDGDMYHFYGRSHNVMVTPNHRMLVTTLPLSMGGCAAYRIKGIETIITAEELALYGLEKTKTPLTSIWEGKEIIKKELLTNDFEKGKAGYECRTITLDGDDYIRFMAMYLSEGWTQKSNSRGFTVHIGQNDTGKYYNDFFEVLSKMGNVHKKRNKEIYLANRKLYCFVRQFGLRCYEKFIPQDIMEATPRQLKIFWDYYLMGDGTITKKGAQSIATTSSKLAGQLQEIAQKIGLSASVCLATKPKKPIIIGCGKKETPLENLRDKYVIRLRISKTQKLIPYKIHYKGIVHCVQVPNGIVYVRRNGMPCWCGNSLVQDLRRAGLPVSTYAPTKDKITRAYMAQSLLENGRIYYPSRQWAEDFIGNLAAFPQGNDDDWADAFSQAIIWLQSSFLVTHADDAKRRREEDERDEEDLPDNVTRFKPKERRKAAYG
jgi:hypothetical protein